MGVCGMDIVVKAVVLGIVGAILCLVVQRGSGELSLVLAMTVAFLMVWFSMEMIGTVVDFLQVLRGRAQLSAALFGPLLKTVGIGILTRLAADICKDAGQSAISSAVELAGTVAAVYVALPLMKTVFEMIGGLL